MYIMKGCAAMKRMSKIVLCLLISLLLVTSAISVYAVNGIIEKKQSDGNALEQKEQYVMAILLEEICNMEAVDYSELVSEEYKVKLINEFAKQRKNKLIKNDMQILVNKILEIWPEIISDNTVKGNIKTSKEKWELIHQLFIHWPKEVDASDAIKAEIEKHMLEEEAFQNEPEAEDVPPNEISIRESQEEKQKLIEKAKKDGIGVGIDILPDEEAIRKSQEEKQKLLEGVFYIAPLGIAEDILPTAESIKRSQEEKEKLIKDAVQTAHAAKDILPSEEQAKRSSEEKQKLLEEGLKNIPISNDVPPNEASIKKSNEEKQKSLDESNGTESADLPPTEESIKRSQEEKQMLIDESIKNELKSADLPPTEDSIRMSLEEKQESMNGN